MRDSRTTTKVIRSNEIIAMLSRVNSQARYKWALAIMTCYRREQCLWQISPQLTLQLKIVMRLHNLRGQICRIKIILAACRYLEELEPIEVLVLRLNYKRNKANKRAN